MKITQEQFNEARKTFSKRSISDVKKNAMLSSIYSESMISNWSTPSLLSPYFSFFKQKTFVALAAVVLLISGTAHASAQSLPGDPLYGIKVNVLEPIRLTFRLSDRSKNEYKISLLKKRVDELEQLKKGGKISEDAKQDSSKATHKNIKALKNSAIFNKNGENTYVSEKVKIYNDLIDSGLGVETTIEIDNVKNPKLSEEVSQKEVLEKIGNSPNVSENLGGGNIDAKQQTDFLREENSNIDRRGDLPLNIDGGAKGEVGIPGL